MTKTKPSILFWGVAVLFVIWNLFGIYTFYVSITGTTESLMAQGYTADQAAFMMGSPMWYWVVFGLAVWSGLLASILFMFRKAWAVKTYLFSLFFVAVSFVADALIGTFTVLGSAYIVIMTVVLVLALIEYYTARRFAAKGVLS